MGSLSQLTPRAYVCSVIRNQGLGKERSSEPAPPRVCGITAQTAEQLSSQQRGVCAERLQILLGTCSAGLLLLRTFLLTAAPWFFVQKAFAQLRPVSKGFETRRAPCWLRASRGEDATHSYQCCAQPSPLNPGTQEPASPPESTENRGISAGTALLGSPHPAIPSHEYSKSLKISFCWSRAKVMLEALINRNSIKPLTVQEPDVKHRAVRDQPRANPATL